MDQVVLNGLLLEFVDVVVEGLKLKWVEAELPEGGVCCSWSCSYTT